MSKKKPTGCLKKKDLLNSHKAGNAKLVFFYSKVFNINHEGNRPYTCGTLNGKKV